jgi:hypothetical protein
MNRSTAGRLRAARGGGAVCIGKTGWFGMEDVVDIGPRPSTSLPQAARRADFCPAQSSQFRFS